MPPRFRILAAPGRDRKWLAQDTKSHKRDRAISRSQAGRMDAASRQPGEAGLQKAQGRRRPLLGTGSGLSRPAPWPLALGDGGRQPLWEPGGLEILRSCALHCTYCCSTTSIAPGRRLLVAKPASEASKHPPGVSPAAWPLENAMRHAPC